MSATDGARAPQAGDTLAAATRWTLRAGAFALPLVVVNAAGDAEVLPKLLGARLLALVLAALLVARMLRDGCISLRRTPLDLPLALFVASAAVSTALGVNSTLGLFGAYTRYEGFLTICTYAAVFWLAVQSLRDAGDARALLLSLVASAYCVSVVAVLQAIAATILGVDAGDTAFSFGGSARATGTLGNPNVLAAFLAMLLPPALYLLAQASSWRGRLLAANAVVLQSCALVLTFSRSACIAGALGCAIVLSHYIRRRHRWLVTFALLPPAALILLVQPSTLHRLTSLGDAAAGSGGTRLRIWADSLSLVRARLLTGWGPDSFGMVYPRYQTGRWTPGFVIDKAHSDLLQVAATQGLAGVAAYVWVLGATARCYWLGRRHPGATALLAGVVAYQLTLQLNFSWVPASVPFWLFLAAAVTTWNERPRAVQLRLPMTQALRIAGTATLVPAVVLLVALAVARPLSADIWYQRALDAQDAGILAAAQGDIAAARSEAPWEAEYAAAAGDIAADLGEGDSPGPRADLAAAAEAYAAAVTLGSTDANVHRHLAMVDLALHRSAAARTAAEAAVALDRFDVRNGRVLVASSR